MFVNTSCGTFSRAVNIPNGPEASMLSVPNNSLLNTLNVALSFIFSKSPKINVFIKSTAILFIVSAVVSPLLVAIPLARLLNCVTALLIVLILDIFDLECLAKLAASSSVRVSGTSSCGVLASTYSNSSLEPSLL